MRFGYSRRQALAQMRENKLGFSWWFLFLFLIIDLALNLFVLFSQSIRLDEAQSLWAATRPVMGVLDYVSQDVSAPLYPLSLHFWIQIFGQSIFSARLLSFLFFVLTLPVLYYVAKESSNRKIAVLTIFLFSLSPFIIWYTSEARMYTLFTFVACLNHLFFLRIVRTQAQEGRAGYVFSTILGLYTHYFFLFLLISQWLFIFVQWMYQAYGNSRRLTGKFLSRVNKLKTIPVIVSTLQLLAFLFFEPWIIYFFLQGVASNTQPLIPPPTGFTVFQTFINFIFGFQSTSIQAILISLWPIAIIFLFFTFTQKHYNTNVGIGYFVLATFFPIILDFLGSFFKPIFLSRYLILTTPTLFFLISWLLLSNAKRLSTICAGGIMTIMFGLMIYQNISTQTPVKENYKEVSEYLQNHVTPQDVILVSAPFTIYPIEYTYTGTVRIETIPLWDQYAFGPIPQFSLPNFIHQLNDYKHEYSNMFVVLSYNQGYQSTITTYLDNHFQRKILKSFSPGLEVREYQLQYK